MQVAAARRMPRPSFLFCCAVTFLASAAPGCGTGVQPGSPACDAYLDEAPPQNVAITVRNEGTATIFLGGEGCAADIGVGLAAADGSALPQGASGCGYTCEQLQTRPAACPADCALPPVVRVDPGGSYQLSWSGSYVEPASMPKSCYFEPSYAGPGCERRIVAPAGDYTLTASAWPQTTCVDNSCDCQPDASGSCVMQGFAGVGGTATQASAVVAYPSETSVEIVFQ
jgi:hypothetical protein